jgi:hypothetical protein
MSAIDQLAQDIALLSNDNLQKLAESLLATYPTRADALTHMMQVTIEDNLREIHRALGI